MKKRPRESDINANRPESGRADRKLRPEFVSEVTRLRLRADRAADQRVSHRHDGICQRHCAGARSRTPRTHRGSIPNKLCILSYPIRVNKSSERRSARDLTVAGRTAFIFRRPPSYTQSPHICSDAAVFGIIRAYLYILSSGFQHDVFLFYAKFIIIPFAVPENAVF